MEDAGHVPAPILRGLHDAISGQGAITNPDESLALLASIAEPLAFRALLDEILTNDETLSRIALQSHHHALGFDKIVIASDRPRSRLRLHVWWPSSSREAEHPHSHRYGAQSLLVAGNLKAVVYSRDSSGAPAVEYRETSRPNEERWTFEPIGTAHIKPSLSLSLGVGGNYFMQPDLIHQVAAPSGLTVTLFLELERARQTSELFVPVGEPPPVSRPYAPFTVPELRNRISRLHAAVCS
jgi:hypothetical protein